MFGKDWIVQVKRKIREQTETINSIIPIRNRIQIEKNDFSDGARYSGRHSKPGSMDLSSADYEYSGYEDNNDHKVLLQKRYI